jgi:Pin2-interacting protein X1
MAYAADLCGSKLRAKLSSTLNESSAAKISTTSFAAKQMQKMGWKEGTGLGKNRDGIVSHIKVKKREENSGLGIEKERTRQMGVGGMWWSSSVADTLMKLQRKSGSSSSGGDDSKSKKKKSKKDKKDKKSKKSSKKEKNAGKIYTEDELFAATGGARFGTKGGKRAEGKWQRSEKSKEHLEWELAVMDKKAEWNGLGTASVILSDDKVNKKQSKKRRRNEEKDGICEEKKEEDGNLVASSSVSEEVDEGSEESKPRKKRKSEKKSKKKKKTKR